MLLQKDELKMLYSKIFSLSTNHCFKSRDRKTVLFSHLRFLFNYNQRICWKFPNWHFALKVETEVWSWRSKIVWAELQNHWQQIKTCCSKFVESIVFLYTIYTRLFSETCRVEPEGDQAGRSTSLQRWINKLKPGTCWPIEAVCQLCISVSQSGQDIQK